MQTLESNSKYPSYLKFELSNINTVIVNTLRRVCYSDIPTFSFDTINVKENTSIYNNNKISYRIQQLPINISPKINILEKKEKNESKKDNDDDFAIGLDNFALTNETDYQDEKLQNITCYFKLENNTNNIMNITTNEGVYHYKGKKIDPPFHKPVLILKLNPNEKIEFEATSSIDTEINKSNHSALKIMTFKMVNINKYIIDMESRGQISEKEILIIACKNIIHQLNQIYNELNDKMDNEGIIEMYNQDHTMGNLIMEGLLKHENIQYATYRMPHPLERKIILQYKVIKGEFKKIFKDMTEDYTKIFEKISKLF